MTIEEALASFHLDPSDSAAWESIIASVYKPLLAYVASLLVTFRVAPGETAFDVVHDVLLTFHDRWPRSNTTIASEASLRAYLRKSCRNLLIDRYRHQRSAEQLVDYLALSFGNAFPAQQDLYRSIFLNEILNLLPEECASMLRTYINEQLTPAEMADRYGASPATFYSRWYRCLEKAQRIFLQKKGGPKR